MTLDDPELFYLEKEREAITDAFFEIERETLWELFIARFTCVVFLFANIVSTGITLFKGVLWNLYATVVFLGLGLIVFLFAPIITPIRLYIYHKRNKNNGTAQ